MPLPTVTKESRGLEPFGMMRRLSDEMDRMFQGFPRPRLFAPTLWRQTEAAQWAPDVEVFTRNGVLVVRVDLPGLSEKDVHVEVADDVLTLTGERKLEKETKEEDFYTCERSYGSFMRQIALPEGAKGDDAKASFKNGVLEVTLPVPKAEKKHARKLEITK